MTPLRLAVFSRFLLIAATLCSSLYAAGEGSALIITQRSGTTEQSFAVSYGLEIEFSGTYPNLRGVMEQAVQEKWDCRNPENYRVTFGDHKAPYPVVGVVIVDGAGPDVCVNSFTKKSASNIQLILAKNGFVYLAGKAKVEILNLPHPPRSADGKIISITGTSKDEIHWTPDIFTVSVQSVLNEKLNDKTIYNKGVFQFGVSGTVPIKKLQWSRGGFLLETQKDLFSTNERDAQSAFNGGGGFQWGLSHGWYIPLKIEQLMQGNQVATNLSAVSLVELSTSVPWGWVGKNTNDLYVSSPVPPIFKLDMPYTHRINQLVLPKAPPLPVDDFALNPSFAFSGGQLFENYCNRYGSHPQRHGPCLNWEADAGLYYLPREDTPKGSQRVEGYWDTSLLVPFSKLPVIPGVKAEAQTSQMQLRVKYGDTVNPAINYERTKKWSFGLEYLKK